MNNEFVIDRIEDGIMTLISETDGSALNLPLCEGFRVGDRVKYEGGALSLCETGEHRNRKKENQARLDALIARSKNKK